MSAISTGTSRVRCSRGRQRLGTSVALRARFAALCLPILWAAPAAAHSPLVACFDNEDGTITCEAGVFVDGYFLEEDVRWTDADYAGFTRLLREREITRVLHDWEPSERITAAITAAGAKLVILNDGETEPAPGAPDPRGYQTMLRANLESLYRAFAD